jgi:LPS-assembly protein
MSKNNNIKGMLFTAFILLISFFAADGVLARTSPLQKQDKTDETLPVNIKAVKMNYDQKGENLIAKGSVEITQGTRILKADFVRINLTTKDAEAKGHVELYENGDTLYCDQFNINLDTQIGTVQSARIFMKQDNIHISGKDIKKLGPNTYEVQEGTVTTCDGETPPWRIDAGKINVTIEGYATVKNSTFRILKMPVLYLPYAILPVKTERQSGFLFPEFGQSSSKGTKFNNSFFWAISENTDATFYLDTASKKGLGSGLEYRFKLKEDSWGKIYGYTAGEKDNYFDDEYSDPRDRDKIRRYLNFEGEHYFNPDFYVKADGSYLSDREMYGDYREEIRRTKSDISKGSLRSLEKDESLIFLNKNWDTSNLLVNVDYYKNLVYRDKYALQRLPQIVFSTMKMPIFGSPFFYSLDTSYDYFWREEGQKGQRIDIFPKISLPLIYGGWLKLDTEAGVQGLSYFALDDEKGYDKSGLFPSLKSQLTADIVRVFSFDGNLVKKLKHTIQPGLMYEYVADDDQDELPGFDIPQQLYRRHTFGYFIKNRFAGLIADQNGDVEENEIGYLMVGQSYNIRQPLGGLYLDGDPDKDYSDVFGEVRFGVWPRIYTVSKISYDPYDNRLRYFKSYLNISNVTGDHLRFGYIYERNRFKGYSIKGKYRIYGPTYAFLDARYSTNREDKLDTEIGLDYSAQCWGSRISIETTGASAGRKSDTSFYYRFYLKGLGGKL